ncbi:protein of unknown function [Evansella caseinilytica]|uniref:DUF4279 domain-containing protein n=1 Tax=Evansella caseinilytica TaxID=1503961 RepID=A0A1H3PXZ1_9BACI|nr:DUF4279 domain-containing protein [Evansella caseinilytica]SDZ05956.1 protein of unknown function [Evansella caseinilytica]
MYKKTSIEVYIDFIKHEPDWDFPLSTVTDKLGIFPTDTEKNGEWANPRRQYSFTSWKYSTGVIETCDFEMVIEKIVDTFKDKVDIINELKRELGIEAAIRAVTHVVDGMSPAYVLPVEVMKFAVSIDAFIDIDEYVYGFVEEDINDE